MRQARQLIDRVNQAAEDSLKGSIIKVISRLLAKGMAIEDIADIVDSTVEEVRHIIAQQGQARS